MLRHWSQLVPNISTTSEDSQLVRNISTTSEDIKHHFIIVIISGCSATAANRFGLAVRRYAGKRKDLGSIPLRLSFLFRKVLVCGH